MNIYVQKGLLTEAEYERALAYQKKTNLSLQESILKLSLISEDKVIKYCDRILG